MSEEDGHQSKIIRSILALDREENGPEMFKKSYELLIQSYNDDNLDECVQCAQFLEENYSVPMFILMKLYTLLGASSKEWDDAKRYRQQAESIWDYLYQTAPAMSASERNEDIVGARRELDELKAYQLDNAPSSDEDSDEEDKDDQEDQDLSTKTSKELTELLKEISDILVTYPRLANDATVQDRALAFHASIMEALQDYKHATA